MRNIITKCGVCRRIIWPWNKTYYTIRFLQGRGDPGHPDKSVGGTYREMHFCKDCAPTFYTTEEIPKEKVDERKARNEDFPL